MINENKLAKEVSLEPSGEVATNIAQIKDVLKAALDVLAREYKVSEVVALIEKHAE